MAYKRIVERKVSLCKNKPFRWHLIGELPIEDSGFYIDDTLKFQMKLGYQLAKGTPYTEDLDELIKIKISVVEGTTGDGLTVYERSYKEYKLGELFARYRRPFRFWEYLARDHKGPTPPYKGNPDVQLNKDDRIRVWILSPFVIVPEISSMVLELLEMRGHIGPEEMIVDEGDKEYLCAICKTKLPNGANTIICPGCGMNLKTGTKPKKSK